VAARGTRTTRTTSARTTATGTTRTTGTTTTGSAACSPRTPRSYFEKWPESGPLRRAGVCRGSPLQPESGLRANRSRIQNSPAAAGSESERRRQAEHGGYARRWAGHGHRHAPVEVARRVAREAAVGPRPRHAGMTDRACHVLGRQRNALQSTARPSSQTVTRTHDRRAAGIPAAAVE